MNRSHLSFGQLAPDPAPNLTAKDRAYASWQALDDQARALESQAGSDPQGRARAQQARLVADQAWAVFLALPQGTGKGPMGKKDPPPSSKRIWTELQAAILRHADPRVVFYLRQNYKAAVEREQGAGVKPYIPTGAGPLLESSSVTFKDVLTVAALTSPAWVPALWSYLR